jgi:hypothetical protein
VPDDHKGVIEMDRMAENGRPRRSCSAVRCGFGMGGMETRPLPDFPSVVLVLHESHARALSHSAELMLGILGPDHVAEVLVEAQARLLCELDGLDSKRLDEAGGGGRW